MTQLHYGPNLQFPLDADTTRHVVDAIGGHATRGGWVSFTDVDARDWTILITPGIAIWLEHTPEAPPT